MIYCISFPGGGYGHYLSSLITKYGKNFVCIDDTEIAFDTDGNCHRFTQTLPIYFHSPDNYALSDIDETKNYTAIIDNGTDNESTDFIKHFNNAQIIKITYDDKSWPVVALTGVYKAINVKLDDEINIIGNSESALRESYFLYLRDCELRLKWKGEGIDVLSLSNKGVLVQELSKFNIQMNDFSLTDATWHTSNDIYFSPINRAEIALTHIKHNIIADLSDIDSLWGQAVFYYYLWLAFGVEAPHNDWADFIKDTGPVISWLKSLGKLH